MNACVLQSRMPSSETKKKLKTLHEIQREILNSIQFVTDSTNMEIKCTQKTVTQSTKNPQRWKCKEISIFAENEMKANIRVKHRGQENEHHDEEEEDFVKNCKVWMKSSLHEKYNDAWHKIKDTDSIPDYIILHLCPNLAFIRTLSYIAQSLDIDYLLSSQQDILMANPVKEKKSIVNVQYVYELDREPSLSFQVSCNSQAPTHLHLVKDEKKNEFVWEAKKGKTPAINLESVISKQDTPDLPDEVDFLEHAFLQNEKVKNRCLHPSSVFNLRYILSIE